MKKLLSILGIIGLTTTSTATLISCNKPNSNENGESNKPEPDPEPPQEPPIESNWKLIDKKDYKNEIKNTNISFIIYIFNFILIIFFIN